MHLSEHKDKAVTPNSADVVIAGSGPAGSIAARHLAQAGCRVLMLDGLRPTLQRLGETLPGAAIRLLKREGLGELASADACHASVTGGLVAWGTDRPVVTDAMRDPYGPGLRLDRSRFDADLRQASLDAGVRFVPTNVRSLERYSNGWLVYHDGPSPIYTPVVVDATGRSARLLRLLKQPRLKHAPLVALYQAAKPAKGAIMGRTLIETLPSGWLYAGKLGDGRWAVGYHTQPETAVRLRVSANELAEVRTNTKHLNAYLGELEWEGPVLTRDARSMTAVTACGPGWFAIGDAVLAFDPIAGQGLFNALRTGLGVAQAILAGSAAAGHYAEEMKSVTRIYVERRQALYNAEARWSDRSFWQAQRG